LGQPFAAKNAEGLFILLVDDICTTGTTMERAAECLLAAGALRVDAAVLARASQHENHGGGEKTRSLS
ncbi:MAG: ComF family protein, partial [Mailhella sp.]